jgi:hypothetical protein
MADMNATADVLDDAADLIEQRGWHRGRGEGDRPELCIGQAICAAVVRHGEDPVEPNPFRAMCDHLFPPGRPFDRLIEWNDSKTRTKRQVVDALREAAKELRNG